MTVRDPVAEAQAAMADGDWERGRALFEAAAAATGSGEAWEGLGWAGWWLHDGVLTIRAREAAYRAYRAAGDAVGAARAAAWVASDHPPVA
jgi:hypothetical protein